MTDSQLANDRTFLAWLRTGIALFGLGFVVSKVAFLVDNEPGGVSDPGLYSAVGVVIVVCGAAVVIIGHRQHSTMEGFLRSESRATPRPQWTRTFAVAATVGAVVLSTLIIVTT